MAEAATTDSLQLLRQAFAGLVLEPGDAGYDEARRVHNGLIDKRPAVIARCLADGRRRGRGRLRAGRKGSRSRSAAAGTTSRARQSATVA